MTAQPSDPPAGPMPTAKVPERNLRAIRAALIPEEVGDFDSEFRMIMRQATETLDLTLVHDFIERWWRVAVLSMDPVRHRQMLENVRKLQAGIDIPTISANELRARLGI